ncbi:MAG: hypothetical protein II787_00925 [Lachnospiraceae bacterium]|nr:hypothetical protein [Lachnospiraceae bacterium]
MQEKRQRLRFKLNAGELLLILLAVFAMMRMPGAAAPVYAEEPAVPGEPGQQEPGQQDSGLWMTGNSDVPAVAVFGDSIMWGRDGRTGKQTRFPIPMQIHEMFGIVCDNYAMYSAGWVHKGYNRLNAYGQITSVDLTPYNTFILQFGNNDITYGLPTGDADSTDEQTSAGMERKCIEYLLTQKPDCNIYIMPNCANTYPEREPNREVIKQVAEQYGVPWINYSDSPVNEETAAWLTGPRNAHPNAEGYYALAVWLACRLAPDFGLEGTTAASFDVSFDAKCVYDGDEKCPGVTVTVPGEDGGVRTLTEGVDYTVSYSDNIDAGVGYARIEAAGEYRGVKEVPFEIKPAPLDKVGKVFRLYDSMPYTGELLRQTETVYVTAPVRGKRRKLESGTDYKIKYSHSRNVGTAYITAEGRGNFTGKAVNTFKIRPEGTEITSVKGAAKSFRVKWKKQDVETTGYQIQYSRSRSFASGGVKVNVAGSAAVSKTIARLKDLKTYYIRVRAYKGYKGKTYYSVWSSPTSVKTGKKQVLPKARGIRGITVEGNSMTVQWRREKPDATGYQLQISTDSGFAAEVSSIYRKVSGSGEYITETIAGLTPGVRHYVRLRCYKETSGRRYYSPWSGEFIVLPGQSQAGETPEWAQAAAGTAGIGAEEGRIMYRDETTRRVQGTCTDHRGYIYAALKEGGYSHIYDSRPTMLRRIDEKGNVTVSDKSTSYYHANSITYCSRNDKLYIATLGRRYDNVPENTSGQIDPAEHNVIGIADARTLKNEKFFSVRDQILSLGIGPVWVRDGDIIDCPYISSVNYDESKDIFICPLRQYYLPDDPETAHQGIVVFDSRWNIIEYRHYPYPRIYTGNMVKYGGRYYMCCEKTGSNYKVLSVLDEDLNQAGALPLEASTDCEFECGDFIGDTFYGSFNTPRIQIEAFDIKSLY